MAGRGIGKSTAFVLATAGASVACLARTSVAIDNLVSEIADRALPRTLANAGDVSDPAAPARGVEEVEDCTDR